MRKPRHVLVLPQTQQHRRSEVLTREIASKKRGQATKTLR
jgi:hypothetical protein